MTTRKQVEASLAVIAEHLELDREIHTSELDMIEVELNNAFNAGANETEAQAEQLEAELIDLEEKIEQARAERWGAMSDAERDAEIKGAMRG